MADTAAIARGSVHVNGIDFAFLEAGPVDGPLALCLHGFPDHAPTFSKLLPALAARGWHAVAPWMRGYPPTAAAPDGRYQSAVLALDTVELVDALGSGDGSVVVGHDWGAVAASGASVLAPESISRVVSLALPHPAVALAKLATDWAQLKRAWYMWFFQLADAPEAALTDSDSRFVDGLWADWSPTYRPSEAAIGPVRELLQQPEAAAAAVAYYRHTLNPALQAPDLADTQQRVMSGTVTVPAMYVAGAEDGCFSSDYLRDSATFCTIEPRIEIVEGCGHFLHHERPEAVNELILDFLA